MEETRYTTPTTSVSGECYNLCISPPYNLPETSINLLKTSPKLHIYTSIYSRYMHPNHFCVWCVLQPLTTHTKLHTLPYTAVTTYNAHSTPLSCTYSGAQIASREAENTGTQAAAIMGSGGCVQPQTSYMHPIPEITSHIISLQIGIHS